MCGSQEVRRRESQHGAGGGVTVVGPMEPSEELGGDASKRPHRGVRKPEPGRGRGECAARGGEAKEKPQQDTTLHLLGGCNQKDRKCQVLARMWRN